MLGRKREKIYGVMLKRVKKKKKRRKREIKNKTKQKKKKLNMSSFVIIIGRNKLEMD